MNDQVDHPAAIAERERIVAWLEEDAAKTREDLNRLHKRQLLTRWQSAQWEVMIEIKAGIAGAISRCEHAKVIEAGTGETPSGSTCESTVSAGNSPENSELHITQSGE